MKQDIKFYIPFEGFYNSVYDSVIDCIIESELGEGYITQEQFENIDYKPIFEAMSQSIFYDIIEIFIDESDIKNLDSSNIIYEGLHSPKYYNYSTDKLKAVITYNNYLLIYDTYILNDDFVNYVNEASKSVDGFASFYEGINEVVKEPAIFLEYLFQWFTLKEYRDEVIIKTCDNINEEIYNNLNY